MFGWLFRKKYQSYVYCEVEVSPHPFTFDPKVIEKWAKKEKLNMVDDLNSIQTFLRPRTSGADDHILILPANSLKSFLKLAKKHRKKGFHARLMGSVFSTKSEGSRYFNRIGHIEMQNLYRLSEDRGCYLHLG